MLEEGVTVPNFTQVNTTLGQQVLTVVYEGQQAIYRIEVIDQVIDIEINTQNMKRDYKYGEEIDLTKQNKTSDIGINISCDNAYEKEIRYFIDCVKNNKDVDFITVDSSSTSVELTKKLINEAIIID